VIAERLGALEPERRADQGVVAHLRVRVERQVVGGQRDVPVKQRAQALLHRGRHRPGVEVPEQAVVRQDELGAQLGCSLEQLEIG
jgi:hypothetical protein